ncbi:type I DNA topoisomerase [Bacteroidetes/Chlorobi group bacterium ChocPot_Mid]|jgi:DNA topoisomerase-1|nr:MAG: type I DNA topoisomerase [Bacteroidetes/Chlorobi group bacterium ChocPot_Mid]
MAEKTLVVVESPAKSKTINKYLGKNYIVEASVGHIKDLVTFKLGVDVENNFQPKYVTIRGKAEVIKKLKQLAKSSGNVLIATDPDREGEAIAWHIAEEIKKINSNVKRVIFNEITKTGIKKGLNEPRELDEKLFMSQQARRVMDRLIGFQVSPFLSRALITKTTQILSAGRVQSVALRIICEREIHIRNFVPIDFWNINGQFKTNGTNFNAKLISFDGKDIKNPDGSAKGMSDEENIKIAEKLSSINYIKSQEQADELLERIKKENYSISEITKKSLSKKPYAPFTTSSLQQEASRHLGFNNKRTMSLAQRLYEGVNVGDETLGLITYMRTDSVRLSPEAQNAARDFVNHNFGPDYVPANVPEYTSKSKNVQDAHEAIRPTILEYTPSEVRKYLEKDLADLYELIFNRFIASQMTPAEYDQTTVEIKGGNFVFKATGSVITFKGFLAVYDEGKENGDDENGKDSSDLPDNLVNNMPLSLLNALANASQTKPMPRYNSASLVKELDEKGIGRPSTYAAIISTLMERNYVTMDKKSFVPTQLGEDVNEVLIKNFPDLFDISFTADMEENLDEVAEGQKSYVQILNDFYSPFTKSLKHAEEHGDIPEIECEVCHAPMVIKVSRKGRFLGCSRYPDCTNTKPLPKLQEEVKKEPEIAEGMVCPECGKPMYLRESRFGKFYGCINYPECKGTRPFTTGIACPKCKEGIVIERFSPKSRKKFYGCSRYPDCDYITKYEPINKKCPKCGHYYIELRFKKVNDEWVKYHRCPECNEVFELNPEQ